MLSAKCRHGREICTDCIVADDAAKRAWEMTRNIAEHNDWDTRIHSFIAIRLSDGHCDGVLYDSKQAAVRHAAGSEHHYAYFGFRGAPNGFASPRDAAIFLAFNRMAYDRGFRLPDPDAADGGPELIMPSMTEHLQNQLTRLLPGVN